MAENRVNRIRKNKLVLPKMCTYNTEQKYTGVKKF